jgi:hypothetical protein
MEEEKIPNLKFRWGSGRHGDLITRAQRRGHAATGHPNAVESAAEKEVADFQEVGQAGPVAPVCWCDAWLHRLPSTP